LEGVLGDVRRGNAFDCPARLNLADQALDRGKVIGGPTGSRSLPRSDPASRIYGTIPWSSPLTPPDPRATRALRTFRSGSSGRGCCPPSPLAVARRLILAQGLAARSGHTD
jgi:hypothetical protein